MTNTTNSTEPSVEIKKERKHMNVHFDIIFKIFPNGNLEIVCISENGVSFISEKNYNIKNSNIDYDLFLNLINDEENLELKGDFNKNELCIILFKVLKIKFHIIKSSENSEKIIQYLCKKVYDLSKKENEIEVIPLTFANGWRNYGSGHSPGRIIKKGNEITLSGLITGTNFSTVCILPEDCRPKQTLIFSVNHHNSIMRFDITPQGNVVYRAGSNQCNWISLDGIHFFADI